MVTLTKQEEKQLVVFNLGQEYYGVDIGSVREIISMQDIISVPRTPDYVKGVINLRGKVIPVVSLHKRFGVSDIEQKKENRIVVVDIQRQEIGMIVDAVSKVIRVSAGVVEPISNVILAAPSAYLMGVAKLKERLVILLDLQKIFSDAEKESLEEMALTTNQE